MESIIALWRGEPSTTSQYWDKKPRLSAYIALAFLERPVEEVLAAPGVPRYRDYRCFTFSGKTCRLDRLWESVDAGVRRRPREGVALIRNLRYHISRIFSRLGYGVTVAQLTLNQPV